MPLARFAVSLFMVVALSVSLVPTIGFCKGVDPGNSSGIAPRKLQGLARNTIDCRPRVPLPDENAAVFKDIESLESPESGHVPNYLRAMGALPATVKPFAHLVRTMLCGGSIRPEVKMIMGVCIGQIHGSPYVTTHLERLLGASAAGERILNCFQSADFEAMPRADRLAIKYALMLTGGGGGDDELQEVRREFNDSQIVELTLNVSFFNYLTRFCETLNLPVEKWVFQALPSPPQYGRDSAVVGAIPASHEEMKLGVEVAGREKETDWGCGVGYSNSTRAMLKCPEIAEAWMAYGSALRQYRQVSREVKLDVAFAVSMASGCRYCTLQHVLALGRLGVEPAKLISMKKDDEALTSSERLAIVFARKLTRQPASITDEDYLELTAEFTARGALEVLLETCVLAFMNRFTDGLHLPSEDEAVRAYKEVYGSNWN